MNGSEFLARLRAVVAKHGTQKEAASALGISPQFLQDVLKGRRAPGDKLLRGLGLKKIVTYTPTGKR